jgi:hypothetical protein
MFVAQALPATNDAAGFEALTWVQVKGIQTLPVLGVSHSNIDVEDLATGFTSGVKGAGAGRDTTFTYRKIAADAGQVDVAEQAADENGLGSIMILTGSGVDSGDGPIAVTGDPVEYAQGYFHTLEPNQATVSSFEGFTCNFKQNKPTIAAAHPTVT